MRKWMSFFLVGLPCLLFAQVGSPKHEFRAVWVATVGNIDWPSKPGLDAETQKEEFRAIVTQAKKNRLNALIVQIRPVADAFYESPFENWSHYLSGKQGQAPTPFYDPLSFMVDECHKACLEFHAWFNPYRAQVDAAKNLHTQDHVTRKHPEWFVTYGGKKYFDPGIPEVRTYFVKIVLDVVKRYDIDAVHFDDYFYPYRVPHQEFPDQKSFAKYKGSFTDKEAWRRNNVNKLIEEVSHQIKEVKPYVKFGISPFGIWRNSRVDEEGSRTNGQSDYDDLYADVVLWLKQGWIDYVIPQLYWEAGHKAADYDELLSWWARHSYGRHVYIGHGLYQVGVSPKACWRSMNEIESQVQKLRMKKEVEGSCYYSAQCFRKNLCGMNEIIQDNINPHQALIPVMPWLQGKTPQTPVLDGHLQGRTQMQLTWTNRQEELGDYYAIYRFEAGEKTDITNNNHLLAIVSGHTYTDMHAGSYKYIVTCLTRLHQESEKSNVLEAKH